MVPGHSCYWLNLRASCVAPVPTAQATGGTDSLVRLWDARTAQLKATLRGAQSTLTAGCFSKDDLLTLASGVRGAPRDSLCYALYSTLRGDVCCVQAMIHQHTSGPSNRASCRYVARGAKAALLHQPSQHTLGGHSNKVLACAITTDGEKAVRHHQALMFRC